MDYDHRGQCPLNVYQTSSSSHHWLENCLNLHDFATLYPARSTIFYQLQHFIEEAEKRFGFNYENDENYENLQKLAEELDLLFDDLCLDLTFYPTAKTQGYRQWNLREHYLWEKTDNNDNGDEIVIENNDENYLLEPLTVKNVKKYVRLTLEFALFKGIQLQMDALKRGFNRVFPMTSLRLFSHEELGQLLCGEQIPQWNQEDLQNYIIIGSGFTHDSLTMKLLFQVLLEMEAKERRAFIQFTTGCSCLPPGGLKNLHPRLKIVRKTDSSYPSVNTCMHYLKLPEFTDKMELRQRLMAATKETGFYLN
jgi:E3 ubiquitin-protein ligase HECTD1